MDRRIRKILGDKFSRIWCWEKEFGINESTVRIIVKARPVMHNMKLSTKYYFPSAEQSLTCPVDLDKKLLKLILVLRDVDLPVSILAFPEEAMLVMHPHNPSSSATRGWVNNFFSRHKLSLRARTSVNQKLSKQSQSILSRFYKDAAKFMRIGKYSLPLVGNMDETPQFFDMIPSKCIFPISECVVRS